MGDLTVGDLSSGRAGDKGSTLDLTLVARDAEAYERLKALLPAEAVAARLRAPEAVRYAVDGLLALKYVLPGALDAGPWASMRAGVHWQKTAVSALLAMRLQDSGPVERVPTGSTSERCSTNTHDVRFEI